MTSGLGFERFLGVEAENGCIKSATHLLPVTFNQRVDGKILRLRAAIGSTTSLTGRIHHRRCTTTRTTIKPSASFRIVLSQDSESVIIHESLRATHFAVSTPSSAGKLVAGRRAQGPNRSHLLPRQALIRPDFRIASRYNIGLCHFF
jgi:hypothetical protein